MLREPASLPIPVHDHQLAEFLGDGVFLSGPKESKLWHEEDGRAEAGVAIESYCDLMSFFPAVPDDFDDVPPGNPDFADIV